MAAIHVPGYGDSLKVGKIIGIGRNYAKHAAEMNSPLPEEPLLFLKPSTSIAGSGDAVQLPAQSSDVHHEIELVVAIGRRVRRIDPSEALDAVAGYAVGLDMTARDLQARAKKSGTPWTLAKGFDTFAPLGDFTAARAIKDPQDLKLELTINGSVRQEGWTGYMIFSVADLVAYCSTVFTLEAGDLLYTGTPEGVGPVQTGDELTAMIEGLAPLKVTVRR